MRAVRTDSVSVCNPPRFANANSGEVAWVRMSDFSQAARVVSFPVRGYLATENDRAEKQTVATVRNLLQAEVPSSDARDWIQSGYRRHDSLGRSLVHSRPSVFRNQSPPSQSSKMVLSTVQFGGPKLTERSTRFELVVAI